jgi:hypothetical protein
MIDAIGGEFVPNFLVINGLLRVMNGLKGLFVAIGLAGMLFGVISLGFLIARGFANILRPSSADSPGD